MKNIRSLKLFQWCSYALLIGLALLSYSCETDGPIGPAGTNGIDGIDGTDGTDGTDVTAIRPADQAAFDAADGLIGGRLYDHFMKELNITDPNMTDYSNFFRCKQCHGWDLRGSKGAYISRAPNDSRPEVASNDLYVYAQTHNIKEIFDAVMHTGGRKDSYTGSMPDYGLILTEDEIWQITKFLKNEAFNTFNLYDMATTGYYPTGTRTFSNIGKDGNAANGNTVYANLCVSCHGADGTLITIDGDAFLGDFMRSKPYEFQHKARSGQPDTEMEPYPENIESIVKDLLKAGQDAVAYPGY